MSQDNTFDDLRTRLLAGDERAAAGIHARFVRKLTVLASRRLGVLARSRADRDVEDVVQSAFRSAFIRLRKGDLEPDGWDGLWRLLIVITLRKCGQRIDYLRAACRDVARDATLSTPSLESWTALARDPSPDEATVLAETMTAWLDGLDDDQRRIIDLGLQGYSTETIAQSLGRSQRTVRRARFHAERALCQALEGDSAESIRSSIAE